MSATIPVHIKTRRTGEGFDTLARSVQSNSGRMAQRLTQMIVREARLRAAVGQIVFVDEHGHSHPGWLKKSIHAEYIGYGHHMVEVEAFYGPYIEFGTRNMRAQPFLIPAMNVTRRYFRQNWKAIFKKDAPEWAEVDDL